MRKDVKLGLLLSFVVVVGAGAYYISKEKTEEPLALDGSTTALKSQVAQATPKTHTPNAAEKAKPTRVGNRRAPAREPAAKRTTGTSPRPRSAMKPPQRGSNDAGRGRQTAMSPSTKVRPKSTREAAPVTKTEQKPATPLRKRPQPKSTSAQEPSRDKPAKDTFENLFQFDETAPASTKPPAASVTPTRGADRPSAPATRAEGERKVQETPPAGTRTRRPPEPATAVKTAPKEVAPGSRTHTVQPGDSYALLAEHYYGSQRHTQFLIDANPDHSNPRRLRVGAVLRIPLRPDRPEKARAAAVTPSGNTAAGQRTYVVREGDTFYGIAARELGSAGRWTELFELNKDEVNGKANRLRVGQVLVLPPEKPTITKKEN